MPSVRRRSAPRSDERGVAVQSFHVVRPRLRLQETATDRVGSAQSQTEQPVLFLGRNEYRHAGMCLVRSAIFLAESRLFFFFFLSVPRDLRYLTPDSV